MMLSAMSLDASTNKEMSGWMVVTHQSHQPTPANTTETGDRGGLQQQLSQDKDSQCKTVGKRAVQCQCVTLL